MGKALVISGADFASVSIGTISDDPTPDIPTTPPVISISAGGDVTITCEGATGIYYTINGSTPTINSTLYDGTFSVSDGAIVKAIAVFAGGATSSVVSKTYTQSAFGNAAPSTAFDYNDAEWTQAYPGISFGYKSQIFAGSEQYSEVQISIKARHSTEGWEVVLLEVPNELPTSSYNLTKVADLGTLDTVADTLVTESFELPQLNSNKKYIVCLMTATQETQYFTNPEHTYEGDDELLTINSNTTDDVTTYTMEYYSAGVHARGSYGYSYYQQKFR